MVMTSSCAGGFKLWECALDLAQHLCAAFDIRATRAQWTCALPSSTRVLELGCGHGLPGILMMLAGCEAHFQVGGASSAFESIQYCKQQQMLAELRQIVHSLLRHPRHCLPFFWCKGET